MLVTFFATMTPAGRMLVACLLSWFSGYFFIATPTFHLAETLSFLPFYLAGHMVTGEHVTMVRKKWIQRTAMALSAFFFIGMMVFSYVTFSPEETVEYGIRTFDGQRTAQTIFTYSGYIKGWQRCHYFTTNVASELTNYWIVWSHRVVYQLITWIMGLAFILMIPHDKQFYTESGGYTIYPYLLQIFFFALERNFIRGITGHGIVPSDNIHGWVFIILSIPFVNLLLSSYWSRKCWWIVFEPAWLDWLLFDTPNKTLSAFIGKEVSSGLQLSSTSTVKETIEEVAKKEGLSVTDLIVTYEGLNLGGISTRQTLEEATRYEIADVKTVHLEPRHVAMFYSKRKIKINEGLGYGSIDFVFSAVSIFLTLALIALTKGSVPVTAMPTSAPSMPHHHH
mmetsp:Transcript_17566/g.35447  ORF Transcript_17566/g.35447 Transcript_17566/m.35447 type:complete len:394 (-) Transcript_17566:78-1259(-)